MPVVFALHGSAGKPSTAFLQRAARLQALLPPDSCVLHQVRLKSWHLWNNQRFANFAVRWLRKCSDLSRQRSTQRQGNKRSAAADLIASNAPLRKRRHKARQNTVPHKSGFQRAASEPFGCSFPSFCQHRKGVPEGRQIRREVGKYVKQTP